MMPAPLDDNRSAEIVSNMIKEFAWQQNKSIAYNVFTTTLCMYVPRIRGLVSLFLLGTIPQ